MNKKYIKILAIETSCDETAVAVIEGQATSHKGQVAPVVLSSVVSSQIDLHAKTGGVVPEVASRAHVESIIPVITEALMSASQKISNNKFLISNKIPNNNLTIQQFNNESISFLQNEIDYIAVTNGPGLIGSLLVGFNTAKAIAYALDKPVIPINHIEGHIYSALPSKNQKSKIKNQKFSEHFVLGSDNNATIQQFDNLTIELPILALTVSGGHTSLTLMKGHGKYETIGQTLDDAAGEAFDKVAKLLDLGYPGGPIVSKLASQFRAASKKSKVKSKKSENLDNFILDNLKTKVIFPRPILNDGTFNFSFSGLKTAVLTYVKKYTDNGLPITNNDKSKICCAFEDAVVDVLVTKTIRAAKKYKPKALMLAGGVAANDHLRKTLELSTLNLKLATDFLVPPKSLCGDNAAMIGMAAYYHVRKNKISTWDKIEVDSNMDL